MGFSGVVVILGFDLFSERQNACYLLSAPHLYAPEVLFLGVNSDSSGRKGDG